VAAALCAAGATSASAAIVTAGHDAARTGWYPEQPTLTASLVGGGTFGQLFSRAVTGQVYAQPLVADGTLFIATEDNWIYGLDPETGSVRWSRNVGVPWNASDVGCGDLAPHVGVTSTPVIDDSGTGTAYFTAKSYVSGSSGPARYDLHAVDLMTGAERTGFPVQITGTAQNNPAYSFNATQELQRPALLLLDGTVYAAFGGHCDYPPYQGWVAGVATGPAPHLAALWVDQGASGRNGAGIWQSGGGIVSDGSGRVFVATGNGWSLGSGSPPVAGTSVPDRVGESVVRLQVQADGTLRPADFFQPYNSADLDGWDADVSSGAPIALPSPFGDGTSTPHLLLQVGKQGRIYLLNRDALGGFRNGTGQGDAAVAAINGNEGVWARPAVWPGDGGYVWFPTASGGASGSGSSGHLVVYKSAVVGGVPNLARIATSSDAWPYSSSGPIVTSNGANSGSGIVWIVRCTDGSGANSQLRAYAAVPNPDGTLNLIWSSGTFTSSKFNPPGVGPNGRIYVGTRDGHAIGFGAPIGVPLSSSGASFPVTTVGATSAPINVVITAGAAVNVTGVSTSSSEFATWTPTPALPASLASGGTLTVPVTFTPSAAGTRAASLTVTTTAGSVQFPLTGTGQLATAHLSISRNLLDFGGLPVGGDATQSFTLTNDGGQPLTFGSVTLPAAPFTATGMPQVGDTLAAGGVLTVIVDFSPTVTGSFSDAIDVSAGAAGSGTVGLSGTASTAGHLAISTLSVDYGKVGIGSTATGSFTVTNDGGSSITITRSKPPVLGPFTAQSSLDEGTVLTPGQSKTLTVSFTPSALGPTQDGWSLNSTDNSGEMTVQFTGNGVVPDPTAGGWTLNGSSALTSKALKLTPATTNQAGSAFWPHAVSSSALTATFTETIDQGTGANGMAFVLADASQTGPTALGGDGGSLGFMGIPGVAVALDTYQGAGDPSGNFVGLTDGRDPSTGGLHWIATSTAIPPLRNSTHSVTVAVSGGTITVSLDGSQVLQHAVTLPPSVLVGLSAGTGELTDRHRVSSFLVQGQGQGPPPPPSLAQDDFSRVVSHGWGSAPTGGAWSVVGSAGAFSVDGSVGTQTSSKAGQTREASLGVNGRDVDATLRLRVDKAPAGGSQYAYVVVRESGNNAYRARLRFAADGHVYASFTHVVNGTEANVAPQIVVPGIAPTANAWFRVHVQVQGVNPTALRLRVWPDGATEPSTWAVSVNDSTAALQTAGGIGLRSHVDSSTTNAPTSFSFDDLLVTGS
jgi:hypothetical protein